MEITDKFRAAKDVIATEMDRETVLMHVPLGKYFSLNETGRTIWKVLEKGEVSLKTMIEAIMDEFEIDVEQCRRDLEGLLNSMIQKGILEEVT